MSKIIFCLTIVFWLFACKKDHAEYKQVATVNVIHAGIDVGAIKINTSGHALDFQSEGTTINYSASKLMFPPVGTMMIQVVPASDISRKIVNASYIVLPKLYTLYIAGTSKVVDTIFNEEVNFPQSVQFPNVPDSIVNVRFINLSPNSVPLKIKLVSSTSNEVDNLPYKGISEWKIYKAGPAATTTYSFQIRNAATDALITTYNFSANATNRFKTVALIIKGLQGTTSGTNAFGVFTANYF